MPGEIERRERPTLRRVAELGPVMFSEAVRLRFLLFPLRSQIAGEC